MCGPRGATGSDQPPGVLAPALAALTAAAEAKENPGQLCPPTGARPPQGQGAQERPFRTAGWGPAEGARQVGRGGSGRACRKCLGTGRAAQRGRGGEEQADDHRWGCPGRPAQPCLRFGAPRVASPKPEPARPGVGPWEKVRTGWRPVPAGAPECRGPGIQGLTLSPPCGSVHCPVPSATRHSAPVSLPQGPDSWSHSAHVWRPGLPHRLGGPYCILFILWFWFLGRAQRCSGLPLQGSSPQCEAGGSQNPIGQMRRLRPLALGLLPLLPRLHPPLRPVSSRPASGSPF